MGLLRFGFLTRSPSLASRTSFRLSLPITLANWKNEKYNVKPFIKQALVFTCQQYTPFENTVGKREIAYTEQFLLFSPQCFLTIWRTLCHIYQIWNCCLQTLSVWKGLKFVVRERVNLSPHNQDLQKNYGKILITRNFSFIFQYANIHAISAVIYFFDIPRIFLEQTLISHRYL